MKRSLYNLIIEIIEGYFGCSLNRLEYQIEHDRFIATFVDGTEELVTSQWLIVEIEGLMRT